MGNLFVRILNMSITAGWIVLAVIVLRMILKKSPKWIHCILWAMVGLRLILPVSITSPLSLIPHSEPVGRMFEEAAVISGTVVDNDFDGATETVGDNDFAGVSETITANEAVGITENAFYSIEVPTFVRMQESEPAGNFAVQNAEKARRWTDTAAVIWIVVTSGMLIYMAVSTVCIRRKVKEAVRLSDNVYGCDRVSSPFILGLFKPCIYLPSDIDDTDRQYVLAHERIHIKRLDYIWKPLSFVLLSVYWFNPLMWVAYVLLCRDIELACDEKVLREYGDTIKRAYSETLINYSISRKSISACPLAFGETGVKGRVKNILNYRKPAFWVIVISIIACIAVAVCFLTNPDSDAEESVVEIVSSSDISDENTDWEIAGNEENTGNGEVDLIKLAFFEDGNGNRLQFRVIDRFTAYEDKSVTSDTFEVLPDDSELLEFISMDENDWVQFRYREQTGWVQYRRTSDPWITYYLVDTNGNQFPMIAVMISTQRIEQLGFSGTSMQKLNDILHAGNIATDFATLLKADVISGEEISSDYYDVYIKEIAKMDYFFNLHMYSIENRYGTYSDASGSNLLVLALFDKTENYLMDVCCLSGDKFEARILDVDGLPGALCKVFNTDDSGECILSEAGFIRTGVEIEMHRAYELEAGRQYGVVVSGGRGTGHSIDNLHVLSIEANGEASITVAENTALIAKIKSKFKASVLEDVTTENGAQVLDVEIDDDGIRHYEFGLEKNDYSFEYVYWGQLVFFEYDETANCMYMECIPSFFFKMAGNDATVDDGIEYPPKCRARLSIGEDGSVSISDMEWLLTDYTRQNRPESDVPGEKADIAPILQEMDACACTNISGWTFARQLIRVAYLENDGVVACGRI